MPVTPGDLLTCATDVDARATVEVEFRNAVGRAYYSAYHDCKLWHAALPTPGTKGGVGGVHDRLIHQLANPTVTGPQFGTSRARAALLRQTKAMRTSADYKLAHSITKAAAQQAISNARAIISLV